MWYTIKSTDSSEWLSSLSAKYLGDWQRYQEIYAVNQDIMTKGPDHVEPGMTLWIPIDGQPRPGNTTIETIASVSRSPTIVAGKMDMNKVLMIAGGGLAAAAILMAMRK